MAEVTQVVVLTAAADITDKKVNFVTGTMKVPCGNFAAVMAMPPGTATVAVNFTVTDYHDNAG